MTTHQNFLLLVKKIPLNFMLMLILTCILIACNGNSNPEETITWKTYESETFSIQYPEEWSLDTSVMANVSLIVLAPLSSAQDNFRENVNVVYQDLSASPMSLDAYVELSEKQILTFFPDPKILESTRQQKDGKEYHKLIYSAAPKGDKVTFEQYYFLKEQTFYTLTFSTPTDEFEATQKTGEAILDSFELK